MRLDCSGSVLSAVLFSQTYDSEFLLSKQNFFFFLDGFYSLFCTKSSKSDGHFTHPVWTSHTVQLALTRAPSSASQALTAFLLPHRFRPAVVVNKCLKATHFVQSLKQ